MSRNKSFLVDVKKDDEVRHEQSLENKDNVFIIISLSNNSLEELENNLSLFTSIDSPDKVYSLSTNEYNDEFNSEIREAGDLTFIAKRINEIVENEKENNVFLLFDSLSIVSNYRSVKTIYRFLNTIVGRLESDGVISFFMINFLLHEGEGNLVTAVEHLFDKTYI